MMLLLGTVSSRVSEGHAKCRWRWRWVCWVCWLWADRSVGGNLWARRVGRLCCRAHMRDWRVELGCLWLIARLQRHLTDCARLALGQEAPF